MRFVNDRCCGESVGPGRASRSSVFMPSHLCASFHLPGLPLQPIGARPVGLSTRMLRRRGVTATALVRIVRRWRRVQLPLVRRD